MEIATSPTREKYPLSPKKITKKTIINSLVIIIILAIIWIVVAIPLLAIGNGSAFTSFTLVILVVGGVSTLLIYLYQRWYYAVYYYDLNSDYIVIKKGPITPREITIPYERVQDVYVDQDLFDRIFTLYDVHLSSATISSGMEAHIDGVEKMAADGLKKLLLETVSTKLNRNIQLPPPQ